MGEVGEVGEVGEGGGGGWERGFLYPQPLQP